MTSLTIALDAMGGDGPPATRVEGAVAAARELREQDMEIALVGDEETLGAELDRLGARDLPVRVVKSEGVIAEGEHPALAVRRRPESSIAVTLGLVKSGEAQAAVSMGSTGATMAASVLELGMFPGLERPTLGGPFIGLAPRTTIIDLGASVDCKPSHLLSFGTLGVSFARMHLGVDDPRVGLLSVGSEEGKGNQQTQEAQLLFQASGLNFVGNVEGHEIFTNKADVVVCDGFVGNVLLKYTEGLAAAAGRYLASALGPDSPAVQAIASLADAAEGGGGPLFGVNGVVIAGHGRSSAQSIARSIGIARRMLGIGLLDAMRADLARVLARMEATRG